MCSFQGAPDVCVLAALALDRPLGIAIMGGLVIRQLVTIYSTPVAYLYLDRLAQWTLRTRDD